MKNTDLSYKWKGIKRLPGIWKKFRLKTWRISSQFITNNICCFQLYLLYGPNLMIRQASAIFNCNHLNCFSYKQLLNIVRSNTLVILLLSGSASPLDTLIFIHHKQYTTHTVALAKYQHWILDPLPWSFFKIEKDRANPYASLSGNYQNYQKEDVSSQRLNVWTG